MSVPNAEFCCALCLEDVVHFFICLRGTRNEMDYFSFSYYVCHNGEVNLIYELLIYFYSHFVVRKETETSDTLENLYFRGCLDRACFFMYWMEPVDVLLHN